MTKKNKLLLIAVVGILSYAIFMRFYRLESLFYFMHDEEVIAFRTSPAFSKGKLFLIGGVTPFHIHLTPYYYYLSGLILAIGGLDPRVWGVFSGALGVLTTVFMYLVGKRVFNSTIALLSSLLYAGSYLASLFDRHYWPLSFDAILAVIVFYALYQIIRKRYRAIYFLTLAFIMGVSSDLSTLLLIFGSVIVWIVFRLPIKVPQIKKSGLIFLLSLLPLVVFDIRHKFSNISQITVFFTERKQVLGWSFHRFAETLLFIPRVLSRLFFIFGDQEVARQYTYCSAPSLDRLQAIPWWMVGFFVVALIVVLLQLRAKKPYHQSLKILFIFFAAGFIGINIYGNVFATMVHDHYLATLFPATFFLFGYLLWLLWRLNRVGKSIVVLVLSLFLLTNIASLVNAKNVIGFTYKRQAVEYAIKQLAERDFALESLGSCYKYGGWRYLFKVYGHEPVKSYADQNYFWLYDNPPARDHPDMLIVMVTPEDNESAEFTSEYKRYLAGTILRKTFGRIEVLLVDNNSHQFDGRF
ncbi:glycosyltransferase family 39 protein [Candidatus Gottesmanbacteria bacterium]|nr:glycosyltransferase family 39 protein [Candidatus Gottesmanbacteria bacterium]